MSKQRKYIDFKLFLTRASHDARSCQVALLPTAEVGETVLPVIIPHFAEKLAPYLPYLPAKSITLRNLVKLGKALADLMLPKGDIRNLFKESLKQAGNKGGVRLRLIIADHELKKLPWEYVFLNLLDDNDSMRGFLALEPRISIMRHEPLALPHPTALDDADATSGLRLMVTTASPHDSNLSPLDVKREVVMLQNTLDSFEVDGLRLNLQPIIENATPIEVADALQQPTKPHMFHFVGHGQTQKSTDPFSRGGTREEGILYFIDDKATQTAEPVKADDLAKYLQQAGVWLVTLGACYSAERSARHPWDSVAGALIARGIPAVVAMQYPIYDDKAPDFTRAFYNAIASGLSLDEAMSFGRLAMYETSSFDLDRRAPLEWGVPVLYSRLPDGNLVQQLTTRESETADNIRLSIDMVVKTVEKGGRMIGIDTNKAVSGEIKMEADRVIGDMIGVKRSL